MGQRRCSQKCKNLDGVFNQVSALEKKNSSSEKTEEGLDRITKNLFKNLHIVFAMDLGNPDVNRIPQKFPFLMSKFVTNHIQPYSLIEYEEMAHIYLEDYIINPTKSNEV